MQQIHQTLLVYVYNESALESVKHDIALFRDDVGVLPKIVTSNKSALIQKGTQITIIPECPEVSFNPPQQNFYWEEDFHRVRFRFMADKTLAEGAGKGTITILGGPIIIGSLKFALLFSSENQTQLPKTKDEEVHGKMYHQDEIFISYSHEDMPVVLACRNAYKALGYKVFRDKDTLLSGQNWFEEIKGMICKADIFQLFWSDSAAKSEYVQREWEHALTCQKREGFIRPVYWKEPMPSPPEKLKDIHFAYVKLPTLEG